MRKTRNLFVSVAAVMLVLLVLVLCGCRSTASAETLSPYERIDACRRQIEKITDFRPQVVIVLGSGLGDYVKSLDVKAVIPYSDIDGWPESTAPLHAGNLVFAEYKGLRLAVMQGRLHFYEGYTMEEVVLPLRVLHLLGAETAILSNAVGSMNPDFKVGEFVCVNDQITSFVRSPLIGQNISQLGDRFFSMTDVFDKDMQETVLRIGMENSIPVHSGVFVQVTGPQFETPAEIRMYRLCGADTVAMSLGAEVIAAAHMGMKVCAINCISNMASGMEEFTSHSINETMEGVVPDFTVLVNGLLDTLAAN